MTDSNITFLNRVGYHKERLDQQTRFIRSMAGSGMPGRVVTVPKGFYLMPRKRQIEILETLTNRKLNDYFR